MDNGDELLGGGFTVQGQDAGQNTLQIIIEDTGVHHQNVGNANFTIITGVNDVNVNDITVVSVSGQHSYTANVVGGDVIVTEEVDLTGVTALAGA